MKTITALTYKTLEVKKSKFISYLTPMNEFERLMEELKLNHPKARHFVYAYRFLNEHGQIVENQSDDGEPKGSSGRPSLSVIRGADLINSGVIIIRYFGGIKLGVGGLVRAYSDSVNEALLQAQLIEYKETVALEYEVPYSFLKKVEHILSQYEVSSLKKSYLSTTVVVCFEIVQNQEDEVTEILNEYLKQ